MEVVNILPTPLAMVHCPFHDRMKRLVMEEIEENGDWVDNDASEGLSHIDHYNVLANEERYARFNAWVEEQAEIYLKDVMGKYLQDTVTITDSWINRCKPGGYQVPHNQSNSYICALYYVNYDNTQHGLTYFASYNSRVQSSPYMSIPNMKLTRYNQVEQVMANEGDMLIWPGEITHGYKKNEGDNRVTVSMNIMPTIMTNGDYGWKVEKLSDEERSVSHRRKGWEIGDDYM